MERVYRWVAAKRMVADRPFMGVGSGNFYEFYKKYTVTEFATYISDNEERSTVHNYFLLILVEQGLIGLGIFALLTYFIFCDGNRLYQQSDGQQKRTVLILLQSMMAIYINLLLSDMLETDKVGPFFFMIIGLLLAFQTKMVLFSKSSAVALEDTNG
jgi:O-antigen ligase